MDNPQPTGGFSSHVQEQLQQASQQVTDRGGSLRPPNPRGGVRGRGGRGQHTPRPLPEQSHPQQSQQPTRPFMGIHRNGPSQLQHPRPPLPAHQTRHAPNSHPVNREGRWGSTPLSSDLQSFPPLGSTPTAYQTPNQPSHAPVVQSQTNPGIPLGAQARAQSFFERARGGAPRNGPHASQYRQQNQGRPQQYGQPPQIQGGDFKRSSVHQGQLYHPVNSSYSAPENPQRSYRHMVMKQSDFLNYVASGALQTRIGNAELAEKESFRKELEAITQGVVAEYAKAFSHLIPNTVKLKCYGSLASGFGVKGSDMDLLLMFPTDVGDTVDIEVGSRRALEKALLDLGHGARLLTNTRVPILRVCQKPKPELLYNLRKYRKQWEEEEEIALKKARGEIEDQFANRLPDFSIDQAEAASKSFAELGDVPATTPLPPSPLREQANLEYKGDCGIQCDINFSNFVAIYNTKLLRTYCQYDGRVRDMGIFIKVWAKARDINTPYHGTLSSYGYVLMVLHYLMNVATPPVIPNLQHLARDKDDWNNKTDPELFEGFDVRFLSDEGELTSIKQRSSFNHESLGSLLRGFFWYYSSHQGFNWTQEVLSIRTKGGIIRKRVKGWTEAKWAEGSNNIRLRYLFCIEDPFEVEHNIARTIGHTGIVAIRDECRRAWKIIERVEMGDSGWSWLADDGQLGEDFLEPVLNRGDLLRRDQDNHRERMKRMKMNVEEAKAKALQIESEQEGRLQSPGKETGAGTSSVPGLTTPDRADDGPRKADQTSPKLTRISSTFQDNRRTSNGRMRKVKSESDDEDESGIVKTVIELAHDQKEAAVDELDEQDQDQGLDCIQELTNTLSASLSQDLTYASHGTGAIPRPAPWDLSTDDGRWLEWRDNKIRNGTWHNIVQTDKLGLHRRCPYDPLRAPSDPTYGVWQGLEIYPPWPLTQDSANVTVEGQSEEPSSGNPSTSLQTNDPGSAEIRWDRRTSGGQWLARRDRAIRAGRVDTASQELYLNSAFPYMPDMSAEEVEAKNEILRKFFRKRTRIPRHSYETEVLPALKALEENKGLTANLPPTERNTDGQSSEKRSPIFPGTPTQESLEEQIPSTEIVISATHDPDHDFIRKQRLAFFSTQGSASSDSTCAVPSQNLANVQQLMKDAGIDVVARDKSRKGPSVSGIRSRAEVSEPRRPRRSKAPLSSTQDSPMVDSPSRHPITSHTPSPEPNPAPDDTAPSPQPSSEPKVPQTLFPDLPTESRPRDEDPRVMPIPRRLGFRFDPRQLRDIAIIKEGGNGCARVGEEFDIEDEYEWGGGGEMGYKESSGQPAGLFGTSGGDDGWEPGRGDEEGLLSELPGFDL